MERGWRSYARVRGVRLGREASDLFGPHACGGSGGRVSADGAGLPFLPFDVGVGGATREDADDEKHRHADPEEHDGPETCPIGFDALLLRPIHDARDRRNEQQREQHHDAQSDVPGLVVRHSLPATALRLCDADGLLNVAGHRHVAPRVRLKFVAQASLDESFINFLNFSRSFSELVGLTSINASLKCSRHNLS